nr:MAG: RNA-dependent RNA polymerase [Chemarfal virus 273]
MSQSKYAGPHEHNDNHAKMSPDCLCSAQPPFEVNTSFYVTDGDFKVLHLGCLLDERENFGSLLREGGLHCQVHRKKTWWAQIIVPSSSYIDILADLWTASPCGARPFFERYLRGNEWNIDLMIEDDNRFYPEVDVLTQHGQFNNDGSEKKDRLSSKSRRKEVSREERLERLAMKDSSLGKEKKIQIVNERRQRRQKAAEKQMFDALSQHSRNDGEDFWTTVKSLLTSFTHVLDTALPIANFYSSIRVILDSESMYEAKFLAVQSLLSVCKVEAKPLELLALIALVFTATKFQRMQHVEGLSSMMMRGTTPTVALITIIFMFLFKKRPDDGVLSAFAKMVPELPRNAIGLDWILQSMSNIFKMLTSHVNPALDVNARVAKVASFIETTRGADANEVLMTNEARQEEAYEALKEATDLIKIIPHNTQEGVHLRTLHTELTRVCNRILNSPISGSIFRKEPVILQLIGAPGLGKTMMITGFIIEGLRHMYDLEGRSDEYKREHLPLYSRAAHYSQLATKYETNFNSKEHRILVCDDANQINAQYQNSGVDPFPLKTIQWKNNAPHLMNVAEVENKRLARFQCELIIATDNTPDVWIDYLMDKNAYHRRIDMRVNVTLKKGHSKLVNGVEVLDPLTLNPDRFDTSAYIFKLDGDTKEYDFFQISAMLKEHLKVQRERFYRNTANFVDFAVRDIPEVPKQAEEPHTSMYDRIVEFLTPTKDSSVDEQLAPTEGAPIASVSGIVSLQEMSEHLGYLCSECHAYGFIPNDDKEHGKVCSNCKSEKISQVKEAEKMDKAIKSQIDSLINEQSLPQDRNVVNVRSRVDGLTHHGAGNLYEEGPWHDSPFEPLCKDVYDWLNDWLVGSFMRIKDAEAWQTAFMWWFSRLCGSMSIFLLCLVSFRFWKVRERMENMAVGRALDAVKRNALGKSNRHILAYIGIGAGITTAIVMWRKSHKPSKRVVIPVTLEEPKEDQKYNDDNAKAPKTTKPKGKPKETTPVMLNKPKPTTTVSQILDPINVSMRQSVQYNMYSIRAKSASHYGELRGLFVCGRAFLVNKHLFDDFRSGPFTLELINPWNRIGPIDNSKFRVTYLLSKDDENNTIEPWDYALVDFGTSVNDHKDITKFFIKEEDVKGLVDKEIHLVSLNCISNVSMVQQWELLVQRTKITRVCEDYTEVMSSDSTWKYLWGMIEYDCQSYPGYCGSLIELNDPKTVRKFVGLHAAGYSRTDEGSGVYVTQEQLGKLLSNFKQSHKLSIPLDKIMEGPMKTVIKNFQPVTLIPTEIRCPVKSNIHKGMLHGLVMEPTKFPAKLDFVFIDGKKEYVMNLAVQKYKGSNVPLSNMEEDVIYGHLCTNFKATRAISEFSHEISIKGIDGNKYISPVNVRSSAGYPLGEETEPGKVGKTTFLGSDGEWIFDHPSLMREINKIIESIENNERPMVFFTVTPKDEVQKPGKLTRQFAAAPLAFVLLYRRYFLDLQANIMENKIKNGSLVGINPMSEDWDMIVRDMQRIAPLSKANFLDGDFANFDGDLNSYILWIIYRYFEKQYCREENLTTFALWNEIVNSHQVFGNTVISVTKGQPSGSPATTILNSLYNSSILKLVLSNILRRQGNFEILHSIDTHFKSYVYGDDNIMAFSNAMVEVLNPQHITDEMSRLGHKFTSSDKDSRGLRYRTLSEISILKRRFVYDGPTRTWLAPLELASIFNSLNWDKVDPRFKAQKCRQTSDNILGAVRELSQHSKAVFDEYVPKLLHLAKEYDIPLSDLCFYSQNSIREIVREIEQDGTHIHVGSPDWQSQSIDPNDIATHFYPGAQSLN